MAVEFLVATASLEVVAMFVKADGDEHRESMVVVVVKGQKEVFKLEFCHVMQCFRELRPIEEGVATL